MKQAWLALVILLLVGCAPAAVSAPTPNLTAAPSVTPPGETASPLAPTATATRIQPTASPTAPSPSGPCSPLEDVSIPQLLEIAKEPFVMPRPGLDDGHHGVDFAYYTLGERTQMLGHPVQSVFSGRVAAALPNRPPYGFTLIIETPLDEVPPAALASIDLTPRPTPLPADIRLSCPVLPEIDEGGERSLYLLYAHLNALPLVETGDAVTCGQTVGEVGTTGNSINPHLHLEARAGPAGASFESMSHYNSRATDAEMANYCLWRVSGVFRLTDPLGLFSGE